MNKSVLVKLFGWRAAIHHGDFGMMTRWGWLSPRLPVARSVERLLDVGCGSGAFTLAAGARGYESLGLSWNAREMAVAVERAQYCGAKAEFRIVDVRCLNLEADLINAFDVVLCFENIEHILDDRKLFNDIARCMKPGARLMLTSPYFFCRPVFGDITPLSQTEDGGHVRRGYTRVMLRELCRESGLEVEAITFCTGYASIKASSVQRLLSRIHPLLGWAVTLPLRLVTPILDRTIAPFIDRPGYSICLEASKPRFGAKAA